MSPPTRAFIESVAVNPSEYRAALAKRDYLRAMHDELARRVDGFVTLASPGPGPIGMDQGSAIFNEGSSTIGMPALSLPYLTVDNAPVGVQLQGRWHEDERLVAVARWLTEQQLGSAT
jgi:Asp-tRNA(Asn)/Glu-tRNA(Gln) amidotransferase A subunit family amidase